MHAGNYDISQIFIDSLYKLVGSDDIAQAEQFLETLDAFSNAHHVNFTVAISTCEDSVSDKMKAFI